MTRNDRIYSREEFAKILERAEDLERRAEVALGSQPGFSLTQMKEIAAEAGIDPVAVERAALLLPPPKAPEVPFDRTTTGVLRQRIRASFPVTLTAEGSAKLLAVIRASSGRLGTGDVTVTGLSWWAHQGDMQVEVLVEEGSTLVEVSANHSRLLILPGLFGAMIAWPLASFLEPITAAVFFGSIAAGLGIAGTLFAVFFKKGRKRAEILMGAIARAMARMSGLQREPGEGQ